MSDVVKGSTEMMPHLKMAGALTVRALDTLPLPLLVVVFLACLALLQWPVAPSPSLLPTFTPPSIEKDRLSPLPPFEHSTKSLFNFSPLPTTPLTAQLQIYSPSSDSSLPTVVNVQSAQSSVKQPSPPVGRGVRRGSKQLREWRLALGVVEEDENESACIQVV
ncbi:uncharacterized protein I303_101842 [Kwoniella dejecticola CBS 10117]|uniref:Uncharacterized protein n=1 Tax=Kwoniella dejecticola CBS 10117 TaxID=1296121 RepID=A0A1A6ACM5_9TREE|nr:uncharacterized protein I303_02022 [Kwoniella dejecticola CBS 10117]OBR87809.1 hypothetical protein I303_02022 [Kwoniella dejecticola CBS 10117]